ncbi:hypothetical protein ABPG72_011405 [Tetrahymena utriculariae]
MIEIKDNQNLNEKKQLLVENLGFCNLHKRQQLVSLKFNTDQEINYLKCLECLYVSGTENTFPLVKLFENDQSQVINGWPILSDDRKIYQHLFEVERISKDKSYLKENQMKSHYFFKELRREVNNLIDEREQYINQEIEEQQKKYDNIILQYNKISQKEELEEALLNKIQHYEEQNEMLKQIIVKNINNQEANKNFLLTLLAETQQSKINFDDLKQKQKKVINLIGSIEAVQNQNINQDFLQLDRKQISDKESSQILNSQINQIKEDKYINQDKLIAQKSFEDRLQNDKKDQLNLISKEILPIHTQFNANNHIQKRKINQKTEENNELQQQNNLQISNLKDQSNDLKSIKASKQQENFEQTSSTSRQQSQIKNFKSQFQVLTLKPNLFVWLILVAIIVLSGWVSYTKQGQFQNKNIQKQTQKQQIPIDNNVKDFEEKISYTNTQNNSLTIDLNQNNIGDYGVLMFAEIMQSFKMIKSLNVNFSNNNISQEGSIYLANSLNSILNLNSLNLDLRNNQIDDNGIESLKKNLQKFQKINSLVLQFGENQIEDQGLKYLLDIIMNLQKINSINLNLSGNKISNEGVNHMTFVLEKLQSLNHLNINLRTLTTLNQYFGFTTSNQSIQCLQMPVLDKKQGIKKVIEVFLVDQMQSEIEQFVLHVQLSKSLLRTDLVLQILDSYFLDDVDEDNQQHTYDENLYFAIEYEYFDYSNRDMIDYLTQKQTFLFQIQNAQESQQRQQLDNYLYNTFKYCEQILCPQRKRRDIVQADIRNLAYITFKQEANQPQIMKLNPIDYYLFENEFNLCTISNKQNQSKQQWPTRYIQSDLDIEIKQENFLEEFHNQFPKLFEQFSEVLKQIITTNSQYVIFKPTTFCEKENILTIEATYQNQHTSFKIQKYISIEEAQAVSYKINQHQIHLNTLQIHSWIQKQIIVSNQQGVFIIQEVDLSIFNQTKKLLEIKQENVLIDTILDDQQIFLNGLQSLETYTKLLLWLINNFQGLLQLQVRPEKHRFLR